MAIQIEPVDDQHSHTSAIRMRVGTHEENTCVEIPRDEIGKAIKALFAWLAWVDNKEAAALFKNPRRAKF